MLLGAGALYALEAMLLRVRSHRATTAFALVSALLIGCYVLNVLIAIYHLR